MINQSPVAPGTHLNNPTGAPVPMASSNSYLIQKPSIAIANAGTNQASMVQKSVIVKSDTSKMIGNVRPPQPQLPNTPVSLADQEEIVSAGILLADLEEFKNEEDPEVSQIEANKSDEEVISRNVR